MQQDGQLVFVIETTDVAAALGLLAHTGAPSATMHVRLRPGFAEIDYLCPLDIAPNEALTIGSRLAATPACLSVTIQALRRQYGPAFAREDIAAWPCRPPQHEWQAAA